MFTRREYDWLDRRFRPYDLIYLDPLVCDPSLRPPPKRQTAWASRKPSSDAECVANFYRDFTEAIGLKTGEGGTPVYWQENGPITKLKQDRFRQRRIQNVIDQHLQRLASRHYVHVASLRRASVESIVDRPNGESLVIVDAMLSNRTQAPVEIQMAAQIDVQARNGSLRDGLCMQMGLPSPIATLHDAVLTLIVDQQAVWDPREQISTILSAGWYPFSRAIGLLSTTPGGHCYLDVLAILVRPYPALDEVMRPRPGESARSSLPGMLDYVQAVSLQPEIDRIATEIAFEQALKAGGAPGVSAPHWPTPKVYDRDEEFLSPPYLFRLCCQLNRIDGKSLNKREKEGFHALEAYLGKLREMDEQFGKDELKVDSLLRAEKEKHSFEVDKFIPKPSDHDAQLAARALT